MEKRNLPEYAKEIRDIRLKAGLTQADFGRLLDFSLYKITSWETGTIAPRVDEYEKIMVFGEECAK